MGIGDQVQGIPKADQSVKEAKKEADQEKKRLILGRGKEQKKKGILFSSKSMRRLSMLLTSGERKETEAFFHELEHLDGHLFVERTDRLYTTEELDAMEQEDGQA